MEDHLAKATERNIEKIKSAQEKINGARQFCWAQWRRFKPGDSCKIMSIIYRIVDLDADEITVSDGNAEQSFRNPHRLSEKEILDIMAEKKQGMTRLEIAKKHGLNSSGIDQILYINRDLSPTESAETGFDPEPLPATLPPIKSLEGYFTNPSDSMLSQNMVTIPRDLAISIHRDLFYLRFFKQVITPGIDKAISDLGKSLQP